MILVAGSTGALGTEIVQRLRAQDRPVRALVRSSSAIAKVAHLRDLGAEIAMGDLTDRGSLDRACAGVATVISTVTMISTAQQHDSFADTDAEGTKRLIDAARAAGARQFLFVSFNADDPMPDSPLVSAKRAVERHLRASGLTWTILRPGLFMEVWLGPMLFADLDAGTAKIYGRGDLGVRYVATCDVAEVAVRALDASSARNAVIAFGGPDAITQREAVHIFEEAFGKTLALTEVPEAALAAQWQGATNPFEKTFASLMLSVARGHPERLDPPPRELGIETMTSVRDFAGRRAAMSGPGPGASTTG